MLLTNLFCGYSFKIYSNSFALNWIEVLLEMKSDRKNKNNFEAVLNDPELKLLLESNAKNLSKCFRIFKRRYSVAWIFLLLIEKIKFKTNKISTIIKT